MLFCFDFFRGEDTFNYPFFIDNKSSAEGTHVFASVHTFFSPYAKLFHQFLVRIGNQREGELVLFNEFLMRFSIIHTYSDYLVTGFAKFAVTVT